MKKPVKIILIVGIILVLLLLVPAAIFLAVDLNDYKQTIANAVHKKTGRTLAIEGKLSKSVFPWLGVEIGRVSFSNAAGFQPAEFARADDIQVKVALLPLFKRQIHVADIVLHGLVVNLAINKAGVSNWADLSQANTKTAAPTGKPTAPAAGAPAKGNTQELLGALVIGGIDIRDAQLRWDDQKAGALYEVDHFNLRSDEIRIGKPIHAELSLNARSNQVKASAHIAWRSDITLNPTTQRYHLANMNLTVKAQGKDVPGQQLESELNATIDADLKDETATAHTLTLKTLGLTLSGDLHSDRLLTSPAVTGHMAIAPFSPREMMKKLAITLPPTADAKALGKASVDFALQGGLDSVNIDSLKLVLDDTTITGKAGISHFAQPTINYVLEIDKINADRYLPPPSKAAPANAPGATTEVTTKAAANAPVPLPLAPLRQLDASGTLDIGHLTVAKLKLDNINTILYAKGGQLRLHPLTAQLYDGSSSGDMKLDVRGDTPTITLDEHIKNVKVEPVLKAVADTDKLSGIVSVNTKLTTAGVALPDMIKSLNGNADFLFNDGEIRNMDLKQKLLIAIAKFQNKTLPPNAGPGKTYFAEMRGSITVTDGLAHNDDLVMNSRSLRVTGKGDVDLPKQTIDYHLQVELLKSGLNGGNQLLEAIAGEPIPFILKGPLNDPKFDADKDALKKMAKTAAKLAVEKKKAKEKEKVKQKVEEKKEELRDKLQDRLKGLFKR